MAKAVQNKSKRRTGSFGN